MKGFGLKNMNLEITKAIIGITGVSFILFKKLCNKILDIVPVSRVQNYCAEQRLRSSILLQCDKYVFDGEVAFESSFCRPGKAT